MKKVQSNTTTKNSDLDQEEQEVLDAFGKVKLKPSISNKKLIAAAKETIKKNKNINIRISENDLESIKMKAAREGLPYQTLIGSLLHKYASGYLKEAV